MVSAYVFVFLALFGMVASDPDHLQDLCVANKAAGKCICIYIYSFLSVRFLTQESCIFYGTGIYTIVGIKVNGFPCKEEANVTEADFFLAV